MRATETEIRSSTTTNPATGAPRARRRSLRRLFLAVLILVLAAFAASGCEEEIDPSTPEGLKKALETGQKLDEAIEELGRKDDKGRAEYGSELSKLYLEGSKHDGEVLTWLVRLKDPAYSEVYLKALGSGKKDEVIAAASAIGELGLDAAADPLANAFEGTGDREIKQALLEAAVRLESPRLTKLAADTLSEKGPEDEHIAVLREACRVLEANPSADATRAALKGMFYADQAGRKITEDCVLAVLAIGSPAIPAVLEMVEGKNEEINRHIARYSDIFAPETAVLQGAQLLARLRAPEGRDVLIKLLADPTPYAPPLALSRKPLDDIQAWGSWAALIGQVNQEILLALNDIGVAGSDEARTALLAMYQWQEPYPQKFEAPIKKGGSTMVEVAARVNAARLLAENGFLDDPETMKLVLDALKDPAFDDESKVRPAARAAIASDLVTYLAIASKPGWTETVWKYFDAMASAELDNKRYKLNYDLETARIRIADVKTAFELADQCAGKGDACYAAILEQEKPDRYQELKAIYELGKTGKPEHFAKILARYDDVDQALGYLYATSALIGLGDASQVDAINKLLEEAENSMDGQKFKFMETSLVLVRTALSGKSAK